MAEQQKLREEAERLQQEKEAQEKARAEQEENERLQRQVRVLSSLGIRELKPQSSGPASVQ